MAIFRISQATPGAGAPNASRHDLVVGEVITLEAISPAGGGASYTWELVDKVGSAATLSATSGSTVTIGAAGDITDFCGFRIRFTADDGVGTITTRDLVCSVRSPVQGLRPILFGETADPGSSLNDPNADASIDNAVYPDLAGTGITGSNWRGWSQAYWELLQAVESGGGGGPGLFSPNSLGMAAKQHIDTINTELVVGGGTYDPSGPVTAGATEIHLVLFGVLNSSAGTATLKLFDAGPPGAMVVPPFAERGSTSIAFAFDGEYHRSEVALAVVDPATNPNEILPVERMYELRLETSSMDPGDTFDLVWAGIRMS